MLCTTVFDFAVGWTSLLEVTAVMSTSSSWINSVKLILLLSPHLGLLPTYRTSLSQFLPSEAALGCSTYSGCAAFALLRNIRPFKFQDVDTSSSRYRLSAVVLPVQSYLTNCPGAVAVCTTEAALTNYEELEGQFNSGQLAGDPWAHVDVFGQANFLKTLTTAFKNLKGTPVAGTGTASRSSSVSTSAGRKIHWAAGQAQKLAYFSDIPPSELSKTVQKLREESSKN